MGIYNDTLIRPPYMIANGVFIKVALIKFKDEYNVFGRSVVYVKQPFEPLNTRVLCLQHVTTIYKQVALNDAFPRICSNKTTSVIK